MNIFRYNDYRDLITEMIKDSKRIGKKLTFSGLAEATQTQGAYITRVLKKDAHFNSDQIYLATQYLKLNDTETTYLFILLEHGRSIVSARKKDLQRQIKEIQMQHRDTRKHLRAEQVNPIDLSDYNKYYLDPYIPLVHIFLSLPSFAKNSELIAKRLNFSERRMKEILQTLIDLRLVKWSSETKSYQLLKDHMQLVANSPLNLPFQIFQRNHAIQKIQSQNIEERFMFSVTFSASETTKNDIHDEFLKFLRRTETLVKETVPSEVFQMNFDLFGWS